MFYTKLFESLDETNEIKAIKLGFNSLFEELGLYKMIYFLNKIGIQLYADVIDSILEEAGWVFSLIEQYQVYYKPDRATLYKYCRNSCKDELYDPCEKYNPYEEYIDDYDYDLSRLKEKEVKIDDIKAKETNGVKSIIVFIS